MNMLSTWLVDFLSFATLLETDSRYIRRVHSPYSLLVRHVGVRMRLQRFGDLARKTDVLK